MRLSTAKDRDDRRAIDTLVAALDAGATLLDTADAYALDAGDAGHNERLIARALSAWDGDRSRVRVATKAGMTRPGGRWVPNGKASHLARACEASLEALDVDRIDLYQLHAVDPRVPLSTSVRALADLKERGLVAAIGLCNVNLTQLEQARELAPIDAVQVELSWFCDDPIRGGLVSFCAQHGIEVIAHSPLGGPRRAGRLAKNRVLRDVARRLGVETTSVVLAYLRDLCGAVVPIPGASRPESARAACEAQRLQLAGDDRDALDAEYAASDVLRRSQRLRAPGARPRAEVVLIMGMPGAGKSTRARQLERAGYRRLNRDTRGGTLAGLAGELGDLLDSGAERVVVDNTYPQRAQRNRIVETAWRRRAAVYCEWIDTSLADAQINAVARMLATEGRLLAGDELKQKRRGDNTVYPPDAQFRFRRAVESPSLTEGFESIKQHGFERTWGPDNTERALIVELHDDALDALVEPVRRHAEAGETILGTAWQPGRGGEALSSWIAETLDRLGVEFPVEVCTHGEGRSMCWCRKPLPGLGVVLIAEERLDPGRCVHIGRSAADRTWAQRLGFRYIDLSDVSDELVFDA